MPPPTDDQLLSAHFAGDSAAFTTLAQRYLNLVHAAALRQAPDLADDITQAVFILLSQKARHLKNRPSIAGWLFTTTRLCASHARRAAHRRRHHEREAAMHLQLQSEPSPAPDLSALLPLLDAGLAALPSQERDLILQRHLQNRPLEQIAGELGISHAAATKRVQRALERLRHWFARHLPGNTDLPAPVVASLLASQAAHQAPSALANVSSASAGATAIAKSAALALGIFSAKLAVCSAAAILFMGALVSAPLIMSHATPSASTPAVARGPALAPAQGPVGPATEPITPPSTRLVHYNMVLNSSAAENLRKVLTPIPTSSDHYTAFRGPTDRILVSLRDAIATREVGTFFTHRVYTTTTIPGDFRAYFNDAYQIDLGGPPIGGVINVSQTNQANMGTVRRDGDALLLTINQVEIDMSARVSGDFGELQRLAGSLRFDGRIDPADSLVFIGTMDLPGEAKLTHASILQPFQATDAELTTILKVTQPLSWIKNGPEWMRTIAQRSMAWQSQAPDQPIPPQFSHKLPSGATISLIAVGSPVLYPFCWWRPDGLPAERDWTQDHTADVDAPGILVFALDSPTPIHPWYLNRDRSSIGWTGQSPTSAANTRTYDHFDPIVPWPLKGDFGPIDIGVAVGPWTDAATMADLRELKNDKLTVQIGEVLDNGHDTQVRLQFKAPSDIDVRLLAVDQKGKHYGGLFSDSTPKDFPSITLGRPEEDGWQVPVLHYRIAPDQIDHWLIQTRHRDWTTFDGFAVRPFTEIPETVTSAQISAVQRKLTDAARARADARTAALRALRAELLRHPDPTTPAGAMAAMIVRARAGDVAGVRALIAPTVDQTVLADAIARSQVSSGLLLASAERRFGDSAVRTALIDKHLLPDFEQDLETPWEISGNFATRANGLRDALPTRILTDGIWRILLSYPSGREPQPQTIIAGAARNEALTERIERGEFPTIESLADALKPNPPAPVTRPTSQPRTASAPAASAPATQR